MTPGSPKLIILGSGFGGFGLLKDIDVHRYDVTVISPRNHFLFTPLLPSTTVGTIEFRSIVEPVRTAREHILYYQAECIGVDPERQIIECRNLADQTVFPLWYDIVVIATGAESRTFEIPGVQEHAHLLRELRDARAIRQSLIDNFERACAPGISVGERKRLLHTVIVGGGPTGVEFAAELHDFVVEDVHRWFPGVADDLMITIFEASGDLLSTFDATLRAYTVRFLRRQRVAVRLKSIVKTVGEKEITLQDGEQVPYGLLVWSTGIGQTPFVRGLSFPRTRNARLLLDDFLRVSGYANVYAVGDCATIDRINLPATAQVAQQEGRYLARLLNNSALGKSTRPFRYRDYGMLAYIGSNRALADLAAVKGKGFSTWLFWRSTYVTKLVSWKNKILVVFDWLKTFLFGRDISRF